MNTEQLLSDRLMAFIREMNEWEVTAYHESKFNENFDIWGDIELFLAIFHEIPNISSQTQNAIFNAFLTVKNFQSTKNAQEQHDRYFDYLLSDTLLDEAINDVQNAVDDNDVEYEYFMRFDLIATASMANIINQNNDMAFHKKLSNIIQHEIALLKSDKFHKFI